MRSPVTTICFPVLFGVSLYRGPYMDLALIVRSPMQHPSLADSIHIHKTYKCEGKLFLSGRFENDYLQIETKMQPFELRPSVTDAKFDYTFELIHKWCFWTNVYSNLVRISFSGCEIGAENCEGDQTNRILIW